MGLKDFFAKPDTSEKEPVLRDRSTILAYLEEISRLRTQVQLWLNREDLLPANAKVELVGEETGTFTVSLQRALPGDLDPRFPIELLFPLDGMRFRCPVRFKERGGYLKAIFKLPECVYHAERREKLRTRFGQRESANVTVLENLFEGHGATGKLINLSLEGLCMRLEKALSIRENRRLAITTGIFRPKQELMVVRLLDLPRAPLVECSGRVTHLEEGPEGVSLGVHLEGLGTLEAQILHQVMAHRIPTFARGFPQKRRRSELDLEAPGRQEPSDETPPQPLPDPVEVESIDTDRATEGAPDRLNRMKKRGRRILLIQIDDLDRAILAGTLLVDGFSQVKEARSFTEALRWVREGAMDLILIEQQLGTMSAQQLLEQLRKLGQVHSE